MADTVLPPDDATPDPDPDASPTKQEEAADAIKNIDAAYNTLIGKQRDSTKEENAFLNLLEKRKEILDTISKKMVGLTGEQKAYARELYENVEEETKRIASVEKYFGVVKGTTKELEEQSRLRKAMEKTALALGMSDTAEIKRLQEMAERDRVGSANATKLEKGAAGIGNVADILFGTQFQNAMIAAIGKSTTLLQGANYTGKLGGQALSNQLFGGTGSATSPVERMEALNKVLGMAPRAVNETSASMNKMIGTMAFFGTDFAKINETFIKGSREAALGAEDIGRVYEFSNLSAKELGLSVQETADTMIDMSTIFRRVGGGAMQAAGIMKAFSGNVEALGVTLLGVEKAELMTKFAQGISSLPFDKMIGLASYATGKAPVAINEGDVGEGGMLGIAIKTFQKISSQVAPGFVNQGVATQKTAEMLGMSLNGLQTVALEKILKGGITSANKEEFDKLMDPTKHMEEGLKQLGDTVEPIKRMDNNIQSMQAMMSTMLAWGTSITGVIPALAALSIGKNVVGALGASGAITEAVAGSGIGAGLVAAGEAIGGATVLGVSAPVLIGGAAIAGVSYEAYKHRKDFGLTR